MRPSSDKTDRLPRVALRAVGDAGKRPATFPRMVTECDRTFSERRPVSVDIAAIEGKLLLRSSTGLVSRTCRLVSFRVASRQGALASSPPSEPGATRKGRTGLGRSSGWMGGWAWKGPGQPVDNGGRARCQRDGLRSEGAARVLFLLAGMSRRPICGHEPGRRFVVRSREFAACAVEPGRAGPGISCPARPWLTSVNQRSDRQR
jgi:hypothetical protein